MTLRRGSLHHKIIRLARAPRARPAPPFKRRRLVRLAATIVGRSLFVVATLLISGTIAAQIWHAGERNLQLRQQLAQVQRDNATLQATNDELATRVRRLRDPEYLVPLIHEQLGFAKPHEVFFEVTQATPAPAVQK